MITALYRMMAVLTVAVFISSCYGGPGKRDVPEDRTAKEELRELLEAWAHKDGHMVVELGAQLFEYNVKDPNLFYQEIGDDSIAFRDYITTLPTTCFTNFSDTATAELEAYRIRSIESLKSAKIDPQHNQLHQTLLERLKSLEVTGVE